MRHRTPDGGIWALTAAQLQRFADGVQQLSWRFKRERAAASHERERGQ